MSNTQSVLTEPTLVSAAVRFKWMVVGLALAFGLAAALFGITRTDEFSATGTLVVEDPNAVSALSSGVASRADRYLQDQILIIQSGTVAAEALDILEGSETTSELDVIALQEGLSVDGFPTSNLVLVTFTADSPEVAIAVPDAVAQAYQDVVRAEERRYAEGALAEIDEAIGTIELGIDDVAAEIAEARSAAPARGELEDQLESAIQEIVALQAELAGSPDAERAEEIRTRLRDLQTQISTVDAIREVDSSDPQIAALQEERRALIERRSGLTTSRNDIAIQLQLASSGVSFYSPPLAASEAGSLGLSRLVVIGLVVGAALGVSLAYVLANRNRVFANRNEPQFVVDAPLLADVPDFADERIRSALPTVDFPRSAAAEAYRFAGASLDNLEGRVRSISIHSPLNGGGKTTTVANLGFAMAGEGRRVLFVDADFGNQELTRILASEAGLEMTGQVGLTDLVSSHLALSEVVQNLSIRGVEFSLLSRGKRPVVAIEFFRSQEVRQQFKRIARDYDLVLIDGPPMLQVAYSSILATLSDSSLLVIEHASSIRQAEDTASRLASTGATTVGYIYNKAPLRQEMTVVEGSMHDILGSQGLSA